MIRIGAFELLLNLLHAHHSTTQVLIERLYQVLFDVFKEKQRK